MKDFPGFMKNPLNKIDSTSQYTLGIEGYVLFNLEALKILLGPTKTKDPKGGENE